MGVKGSVYDQETGETVDGALVRVAKFNEKTEEYESINHNMETSLFFFIRFYGK
jgi:hypothetical protein